MKGKHSIKSFFQIEREGGGVLFLLKKKKLQKNSATRKLNDNEASFEGSRMSMRLPSS